MRLEPIAIRGAHPMTPVQLPEVPEWSKRDDLGGLVPSEIRAQLRAYATEAVMAERARFQAWPVTWADYWASQGNAALAHDFDAFAAANEWADANLRALLTQPEQNSV